MPSQKLPPPKTNKKSTQQEEKKNGVARGTEACWLALAAFATRNDVDDCPSQRARSHRPSVSLPCHAAPHHITSRRAASRCHFLPSAPHF